MSNLIERLKIKLPENKEYRHGYFEETLNTTIATQIKVLREQRGWTQERLAQEAGMKQERISALENANYSSWSINTLKRLAYAFDLRLSVTFEEFGSGVLEIEHFNRESLERCSIQDDPFFHTQNMEESIETTNAFDFGMKPTIKRTQGAGDDSTPIVSLDEFRKSRLRFLEKKKEEKEEKNKSGAIGQLAGVLG